MEFAKLYSDVLFLKGLKAGKAIISARIMEPGYDEVESTSVEVSITEPFVVVPQNTVYILPTTKFNFGLAKVSMGVAGDGEFTFHPISLPNRQFQWNLDNSERGDIGEDGLFISKDKEGFVNILVVDQFIANNTAEGSVKVVAPHLLDINIADVTE